MWGLRFPVTNLGRLPEYQPERFVSPVPGWRSPEGYSQAEALFALGETVVSGQPQTAASGVTPDVARPEGVEAGVEIRRGTPVYCHDGKVGTVDLVLLDAETGRISHLVIRQGFLLTKDRAVPIEWTREISANRVYLDVGKAQLKRRYHPYASAGRTGRAA